jgi:hypothetical protein
VCFDIAACSQEAFTHVWELCCEHFGTSVVVCMHLCLCTFGNTCCFVHALAPVHPVCVSNLGVSFVPFWCLQACFSTFVWVQALDLVIVASRSGALCALPSDSGLSVQLCVGLVFASHIVITYLCAGTLVWRMDRDARQSFVRQQQHGSVSLAAA